MSHNDAYGTEAHDIGIGGDVLCCAALSDEFSNALGTMLTTFVEALPQEDQDNLAALRSSNRLVDVEGVANTAVYLCSDYSKDMVGIIVSIDGGSIAQ